jgi:hypothetical protein
LDAAVVGLEGAECHTPLTQAEQIAAHLFLAQFVRRTSVMRGQIMNRDQVKGLGSGCQPSRPHVFDHTPT